MNIGLIGCGRVSETHMCAYKNIPEAKVVAVSDINFEKAKAFAEKYGIRNVYKDYLKILEMNDLDYVDICTPTSTHVHIACEAAKFGHNVLLEKPMARSTKECDRIINEISKNKSKLCVCHNQLFIPHIMYVKNMVDSGKFDLIYMRTHSKENPATIGAPTTWITTPEHGGILWEEGVHLAYLHLHFLPSIIEVSAVGSKIKYSVNDQFSVLLRTSTQVIGVLEVSWFAKRPEILYEFTSSEGKRIQIVDYNLLLNLSETPKNFLQGLYLDWKTAIKKWVGPILDYIRKRELLKCLPHHSLITAFISSIKNDADPPVTPEDGRKAIHLLECIQVSLDTNKPVKV